MCDSTNSIPASAHRGQPRRVADILSSRQGYTLPSLHQQLLRADRYTDYTHFIACISKVLQIPRTKVMFSIPFEELRVIVRNRYRQILNGKTLRNPPSLILCVKMLRGSPNTMPTKETCFLRYIKRECAAEQSQCPYCGRTWQLLSCGNKPISIVKYFKEVYNKYRSYVTLYMYAALHKHHGLMRVFYTVRILKKWPLTFTHFICVMHSSGRILGFIEVKTFI